MSINQAIIKNKIEDEKLLSEGYAIIPFLNQNEVKELETFFEENHKDIPTGLYASAHAEDVGYRMKMNDKIKTVFKRANIDNFINHTALGGTYMSKSPGKEGLLYPHQDWNIVDESKWRSFNVWVPLVDVDETNGSIQVLPKSHLLGKTYRGINIDSAFKNIYQESWKLMKTLKMKAGEALVYDHRLLHASKENNSDKNRLVVVYGIIPEGAEMRYYYQNNNLIEEFACYPDFFLKGNPAAGPNGLEKISDINYNFVQFNKSNLKKINSSLFEKWKFWK